VITTFVPAPCEDAAIFPVSTVFTLAMTYIEPPATGTRSEMDYGSLSALELEDLQLDLRVWTRSNGNCFFNHR
jgi:hypothetical protein